MLYDRGPLGLKTDKVKDRIYIAQLHQLPCVICEAFGEVQVTPTEAHHVIHGRFSQRKTPDRMAISLCADHHRLGGNGKIAIHREPQRWRDTYGNDYDYTAIVHDKLEA